jgi:UDP-N-acetylglucosamine/UDP-N-acetylgalactosamine diphosphorylase
MIEENPRRRRMANGALALLKRHGQVHLIQHYNRLPSEKKKDFLRELEAFDLDLIFKLHRDFCHKTSPAGEVRNIRPASVITLPRTEKEKALCEEARTIGESLLKRNEIAVLIVAGGQGSRLGYEGPKGAFPISPVRGKPFFQLFAESVRALSIRYQAVIPLLVMTSGENDRETRDFFASHSYFGLHEETVFFFLQAMLPSVTPEGNLILKDETHLFVNPDGHGGSLKALSESGLLQKLAEMGISELFYCQVDNPLVKIADPVFIGHHRMAGADISTKVVRRRDKEEKVGVYVTINGQDRIVEYTDLIYKDLCGLDPHGAILHWPGNIAIHVLGLPFIRRLNRSGFALPYHCASKSIEAPGAEEGRPSITGWKLETFLFDAIPLAQKACCMEVIREEEFSPVKNGQGSDSPETARRAINNLFRSWLEEAGLGLPPEVQVEISPLFALDKEELARKLRGKSLPVERDLYLE